MSEAAWRCWNARPNGSSAPAFPGRSDHVLDLRPGDTVVLYTDGLLEHQRTGIDEGLRRLSAVLAGLAGRSAAEVCDEVLDRVVTGPADDDSHCSSSDPADMSDDPAAVSQHVRVRSSLGMSEPPDAHRSAGH